MPQGEDARQRIYENYDKAKGKGVYAECDDPDSDEYYLDPAEKRELYKEKLAAEKGETQQDRSRKAMEKIYAKTTPPPETEEEPNPFDDRPALQKAVESFLDKNPGIPESARKDICRTAEKSFHPDVFALRKRAEQTGDTRDYERWLARAAEIAPVETKLAADRAVVEAMQRRHMETKGPV